MQKRSKGRVRDSQTRQRRGREDQISKLTWKKSSENSTFLLLCIDLQCLTQRRHVLVSLFHSQAVQPYV